MAKAEKFIKKQKEKNLKEKIKNAFLEIQKNPYIGEKNKLAFVEEEKLEAVCDIDIAKKVLKKLREVHPYEEPGIDIIPLIDEEYFKDK